VGKYFWRLAFVPMSLTHVAQALRDINQRHGVGEIAEKTGVHVNTIRRILQYGRGQKGWALSRGVLNGLESSTKELPWPDGKSARDLYKLPDSDLSDLPALEARLADAIAAMVTERLTKRVRVKVRLRDAP
jgi:hypothetical protein